MFYALQILFFRLLNVSSLPHSRKGSSRPARTCPANSRRCPAASSGPCGARRDRCCFHDRRERAVPTDGRSAAARIPRCSVALAREPGTPLGLRRRAKSRSVRSAGGRRHGGLRGRGRSRETSGSCRGPELGASVLILYQDGRARLQGRRKPVNRVEALEDSEEGRGLTLAGPKSRGRRPGPRTRRESQRQRQTHASAGLAEKRGAGRGRWARDLRGTTQRF